MIATRVLPSPVAISAMLFCGLLRCADQLDVKGNHVPGDDVSGDPRLGADQATAGVLDDGVCLAKNVIGCLAILEAFLLIRRFSP